MQAECLLPCPAHSQEDPCLCFLSTPLAASCTDPHEDSWVSLACPFLHVYQTCCISGSSCLPVNWSCNLQVIQSFPGWWPSACGGQLDLLNSNTEDVSQREGRMIESHPEAGVSNLFFRSRSRSLNLSFASFFVLLLFTV